MSNPLRDHVLQHLRRTPSVPAMLFHYGPPSSLLGMFREKRIWATEVRYLNDSQEFAFAAELCEGILVKHEERNRSTAEGLLLTRLLSAHRDVRKFRVFAASFSELDDVLSQWRAYTPSTGGYAMGFSGEALQRGGGARLLRCVYDRARQVSLYEELLKAALSAFRRLPEDQRSMDSPDAESVVTQYTEAFLILLAALKDPGFEEECEWRLVVHDSLHGRTEPEFREGRGGIVPFIRLPFGPGEVAPPVKRVVIGPTPHGDLARASVEGFLKQQADVNVEVVISRVPYRTW